MNLQLQRRRSRRQRRGRRGEPLVRFIIPLSVFLSCSALLGCLEMIRRPVANAPGAQLTGNREADADVKEADATDESSATGLNRSDSQTRQEDARPVADAVLADPSAATVPVAIVVSGGRTGGERDGIKKVNEYVLWCIKQGMWSEAQHHLEQSLLSDSLSASVHNNLGIIYERLGERENAAAAYARASELNVDNEVYRMNLQLLQQGARFDPSDTLATDAPDDASPAPDQDPVSDPSGFD